MLALCAACSPARQSTPIGSQTPESAVSQAALTPTQKPAQPGAKPTLYIPPTAEPGATRAIIFPTLVVSPTATRPFFPTVTPNCRSDLKFLEDLTIPDGTTVSPGEQIDKRWLVENSGACNWDERFTLRLFAGDSLGAPVKQALYPARSGAQAVIRMIFTAPAEPGSYQSAWKAFDPEGMEFGEAIFIQIVVR